MVHFVPIAELKPKQVEEFSVIPEIYGKQSGYCFAEGGYDSKTLPSEYDITQVTPLFPASLACELQEFLGFPVDIGFEDVLQDKYIGHSVSKDIVEL